MRSTPRTNKRRPRDSGAVTSMRLRVVLMLMLMLLSVLAARLTQLQGLDPQGYAAQAQAAGLVHLILPASRGEILDRSGHVLAESVAGDMIVADPTMTVGHAADLAKLLTDRLRLDYFTTLQALTTDRTATGTPLRFAYIARRVPADRASAVVAAANKAGWSGLFLNDDPIRYYPGDDLAANILGFVNGQGQPGGGLEQSLNSILSGHDGAQTYESGDGARIPLGENTEIAPIDGQTVHLTIDRDVQWMAQTLLRQAVIKHGGTSGAAVVMDVHSGQILALADYPSFDSNHPAKASPGDWGSLATSSVYEPGSVEKVLTSSALIDQGLVTPTTQVVVPPYVPVLGHDIHDEEVHGTEHLTLTGIIAQSSNIGMTLAARTISSTVLGRYLKAFGLGSAPHLGLPGASAGILPPPRGWNALTHATIAFGQGISVTAVQMAAAVNTVANGGTYVAPSLILGEAHDANGHTVGSETSTVRRVISRSAASAVAKMMQAVAEQGGTAPKTAIPGYVVSGKTGTAQEAGPSCGCYDHVAVSFAGFAPSAEPRFTVYVVVQHPFNWSSGAGTAGPVFRALMGYLLQRYAIPPSGSPAHLPTTW